MIVVHERESIFCPRTLRSMESEWREGMCAGDVAPADSFVYVNGLHVERNHPIADGEHVTFAPCPHDAKHAAFAVLITGGLYFAVGALAAALFAVGQVLQHLLGPKVRQVKRGDEESPTHGWSGMHNSRVEGLPIQRVYGEMRVPFQIVDEFVLSRVSPAETDYYVKGSFGEGPLYSIGDQTADNPTAFALKEADATHMLLTGCQVNGNDAENFSGIEAHVRLGTLQQESIPGFELTRVQSAVSFELTQLEDGNTHNSTQVLTKFTYNVPATSDPVWDVHGRAFDLDSDEFDGVTVTLQFDAGLYSVGTNLDAEHFDLLMRYRELDGGGSPITTGGPDADGYVRVFPFPRLTVARQNTFTVDYTHFFLDPGTYGYDTLGFALDCTGSGSAHARSTANLSLPATWTPANALIPELTIEGWLYLSALSGSEVGVFAHANGTDLSTMTRGWAGSIAPIFYGAAGSLLKWVPVWTYGQASGASQQYENKGSTHLPPAHEIQPNTWYHLAFVYKLDTASTGTITCFLNGVQAWSKSGIAAVRAGDVGDRLYAGNATHTAQLGGLMDEMRLHALALTSADIVKAYNGGAGNYGSTTTTLVAGFHFDTAGSAADYSGNANDMALFNSATTGTTDGIVFALNPNNTRKRSKYRVEIMRANVDSTSSRTQDNATWIECSGLIDEKFSHPGTPLLALKIPAQEQLNSQAPTITQLVKGALVPVWDGNSASQPACPLQYSDNPAWCALDMLTNKTCGMGTIYELADVDMISLQAWADYCDEKVYDHRGSYVAPTDWTDMAFTSAVPQSYITITFTYADFTELRGRLKVGDYLGWTGVPVVPGFADTNLGGQNLSATDGLQIRSFIDFGNAITVYWDEAAYGAPWNSGFSLSTFATPAGTITARERRFVYAANFDDEGSAWDRLLEMCATARATPIREGKRIRFKHEAPRVAVDIVSQSSIVEGSFEIEYGGFKDRPNAYVVDFLDRDSNFERSPASLEDPSVQNATTFDQLRRESQFLRGVTRRSQVMRHMAYLLNTNALIKRRGSFRLMSDAIGYEAGDVLQPSLDIVGWGQSGRVGTGSTDTEIILDVEVTIGADPTNLKIRNQANGAYESRLVISAPGTYDAGDIVEVANAFTFTPALHDPFVLGDEDKLIQVVSISIDRELERTVQWVDYDEDVYDDDWFEDLDAGDSLGTAPIGAHTFPGAVIGLTATEIAREGQAGSRQTYAALSWTHDGQTLQHVAESVVWSRPLDGGEWLEVGRVKGQIGYIVVPVERAEYGVALLFAVQPVSTQGVRRRPEDCSHVGLYPQMLPPAPDKPESFSVAIVGDQALYTWARPSLDRGLEYEARRGCWILGQEIFRGALGNHFGPVYDWASGPENAAGDTDPTIYLRSVTPSGQMSDAATAILSPDDVPSLSTGSSLTGETTLELGNTAYENQAWEDWGGAGAWLSGGSPDATLTNGQITDGYLEFAPGQLAMSYETVVPVSLPTGTAGIPRRCMVEAFAVGEQVFPTAIEDFPLPIGHPAMARFLLEGPMFTTPDEPENCTLTIQWTYADGPSGYLPRREFKPGVYRMIAAKFRLVVTRPSTDYQVRIFRFCTRVRRMMRQNEERTPLEQFVRAQVLRIGA